LDWRWNRIDATTITGSTSRQMSVSCTDIRNSSTNVRTSSSVAETNCRSPNCTSSLIESISDVSRETRTPAFSRS
jgi:hypothetical protein